MTPRALRLIRGWTGALAATSVAAASHVVAGGSSPEPLLLQLALASCGLACTALTGRGLSLWRLSAGVALSQGTAGGRFPAHLPACVQLRCRSRRRGNFGFRADLRVLPGRRREAVHPYPAPA